MTNGRTNNRLHTGPAVSNAGPAPHPAIATTESPDVYDPRRAAGTEKARGFATGHGVRLAPEKAASRVLAKSKKDRVGAQEAYDQSLVAAQARRIQAVQDYESGRRLGSIAVEHGVTARTVMYWVNNVRRHSVSRDYGRAKQGVPMIAEDKHIPGLLIGAGGTMSDKSVRMATQKLGHMIVALQRKLGLPTFKYRSEA